MCAGCGSLPRAGSSYAVPGALSERRATPWTASVNSSAPMSQSLLRALAQSSLPHQRAEHVRDALVEGTRLATVGQAGGELRDAMGQLVPDDVEADGEAAEVPPVAIAEDHLRAVPEGVVVVAPVVDGGQQRQASAVEGVAAVCRGEQLPGRAQPVVGLVRG